MLTKVCKRYLVVQGKVRVPSGPRYAKGSWCSRRVKGYLAPKVCQGYLVVQAMKIVYTGPRYAKGAHWSEVGKGYLAKGK